METLEGDPPKEVALNMIKMREDGSEEWPRLPTSMTTCEDYEKFAEFALANSRLLDVSYHSVMTRSLSSAEADGLATAIDSVTEELSEFWFMHSADMSEESRLTRGDLPSSWRTAPQVCSCAYFLACVTRYALGCVARPESSERVMKIDALSFPGIARQHLAQFSKPIAEYTASEVIWALDALATQWYAIECDASVSEYVSMLALRYGMFLRFSSRPEEFGSEELRAKPAKGTDGAMWCAPSVLFRDVASGRLAAFVGANWRMSQHESVAPSEFDSRVIEGACASMESTVAIVPNLKRPLGLPPLDARFGALQVAELLLRYSTESATSETFRETFSKVLVECALCPGDMDVFAAKHRHMSKTSANAIKLLRGDRYCREVYRKARVVGPEPFLRSAVEKLRSLRTTKEGERSTVTFDEEIAALCMLDTLCKNRYGFGWYDEFFVTGHNHQTLASNGTIPRAKDIPSLRPDVLHARLPRVAMLCNTFDLLFEGRRLKTGSAFESIAWWMDAVRRVYDGRIPDKSRREVSATAPDASSSSSSEGEDRRTAGPTRRRRRMIARPGPKQISCADLRPLCDVVRKGHGSFVVSAGGCELTRFGVMKMGGSVVTVIDDGN